MNGRLPSCKDGWASLFYAQIQWGPNSSCSEAFGPFLCRQLRCQDRALVVCYSGDDDEPDANATARFIKRPDWVEGLRCEVIEMGQEATWDARSEWTAIYYRCIQEGPVAAFDYKAYIRENIPERSRQLENVNGQVFWINKTRDIIWSFSDGDRMEVVATHSLTLGDLARRYQLERVPAEQ